MAMARMVRELQMAFISAHEPVPPTRPVQKTFLKGRPGFQAIELTF